MEPTRDELDTLFTFFNEIGIVDQLATTRFERRLPDGLTLSQFSVLNNFVRLGGTRTPAQLASAFQVTRGAMTNTLRRLVDRGAVTIAPSPGDGRAKIVRITRAGRRLRERALRAAEKDLALFARALDVAALAALLPVLQDVRRYLDEHRAPVD